MANDIKGVPPNALPGITDVAGNRRVAPEKQDSQGTANTAAKQSADTVALTDGARLLQKVESELATAPEVDTQRVAELKQAIASGDYRIDDRDIADKLLRSDAERK